MPRRGHRERRRALAAVALLALVLASCTRSDAQDPPSSTSATVAHRPTAACRVEPEPDWCIGVATADGVRGVGNQGTAGPKGDLVASGPMPAPIPPDAWTGLRTLGPFASVVGAWPRDLDVRWSGRMLERAYDPGLEWVEALLVTIDEDQDYLEPGWVHRPDGVHIGLDYRLEGESSEREWVSGPTLDDPFSDHDIRVTRDAATGVVAAEVDGRPFDEHPDGQLGVGLAAPPARQALDIGRRTALLSSVELRTGIDGAVAYGVQAAGSERGATVIEGPGGPWTSAGGVVVGPFARSSLIGAGGSPGLPDAVVDDDRLLDLDATDSATWALRWDPQTWGPSVGAIWWNRSGLDALTGSGTGWALAVVPGTDQLSWLVTDDEGHHLVVDLGPVPDRTETLVVVLDRRTSEVRAVRNGQVVATADATDIGAITGAGPASLDGYYRLIWAAQWRKALSASQMARL